MWQGHGQRIEGVARAWSEDRRCGKGVVRGLNLDQTTRVPEFIDGGEETIYTHQVGETLSQKGLPGGGSGRGDSDGTMNGT